LSLNAAVVSQAGHVYAAFHGIYQNNLKIEVRQPLHPTHVKHHTNSYLRFSSIAPIDMHPSESARDGLTRPDC